MKRQAAIKFIGKAARWLVPLAAILVLGAFYLIAPPGLLGKADGIGYAVCHRLDHRSFHIGERALPLCARCTGTFMAAAIGLLFQALAAPKRGGLPPWKIGIPLILFVLFWSFDGANSYLYLIKSVYPGRFENIPNVYIPNNPLRLLTGSGMGLAMSAGLYPVFNQTFWKDFPNQPALGSWKRSGLLAGIMLLVDLGILTEHPVFLYPAAVLSTIGVLALLSLVFSMLWVMISRQENQFTSLNETWLPLAAGLTIAMIMILSIDLFRLQLTGTWGEFPLG
ncbi:MAG: DUF2085 domain-containing protein [Anaerolineales bacterium]|nr:DUF2085 domain-containing protein [Anaerolineales bacterium]